ncbi:KH domain-containing protein [Lederbergia citrea]|uniref:RNA-binding protein KhpA n=1 Tax=Lederbergia citrea TaxID=2833581 RepID=A0A942UHK8_9BACI|nr:KH domain-containing protein [Lederbergia citrea]MBS4177147.1 KH domain-containing protein [Lederbergia citrea]MBS4203810.1 KH domain-containing protein [Lederbergia citrea]MBS4221605.1 KH domain-containing protein [Lederbergia citrea]
MQELILSIVKPIVDYPDDVRVHVKEEEQRITYHLSVHENDIGKVIGRHGRVAKAIRTVVYAAAGLKQHKKVYMEIDE